MNLPDREKLVRSALESTTSRFTDIARVYGGGQIDALGVRRIAEAHGIETEGRL